MTEKINKEKVISTIWLVSREYDGLAGVGGVKDVCRQLAEALVYHGQYSVRAVLPLYGFMDPRSMGFVPVLLDGPLSDCSRGVFAVDMNYPGDERRENVSFWQALINGVVVYLVDADIFREKSGVYTYTEQEAQESSWKVAGMGHYDYFAMNILLQKAALTLMILLDERPDIIHCQDGHAATLPAMVRENEGYRHFFRSSGLLVTIHNAGIGYHQDVDDLSFVRTVTGLPAKVINTCLLGKSFDPFLAAAGHAIFNAVSENYARELRETTEDARTGWLGHQLQKRGVRLEGVTNGINPADFNPMQPEKLGLAAAFDPGSGELAGKAVCKEVMLQALNSGDTVGNVVKYGYLAGDQKQPLLTFIGRLTHQKGVDVLVQCLSLLLARDKDFQILILGSGSSEFEDQLINLTIDSHAAGRVCFLKGYDPDLAIRIYAAGDFFLVPSQYEPCGLTDYIAQLFGNLPIVHYVGGLVKVVDRATGFVYLKHEPEALSAAIESGLQLYRYSSDIILSMQQAAVRRIYKRHTWEQVMTAYLKLYQQSLEMICHDE
jgi:starch synthase